MINPTRSSTPVSQRTELRSREIHLFEPPADAVYTIEATSRIVDVPRRRILVYCKYHLLSPATNTTSHGYYFDRDAIRSLRRIEALRTVCGDDFAGMRIIPRPNRHLGTIAIGPEIIVAREGRRFLGKKRWQSIRCF